MKAKILKIDPVGNIVESKEWANLNGFEWKCDQEEWERICKLYE